MVLALLVGPTVAAGTAVVVSEVCVLGNTSSCRSSVSFAGVAVLNVLRPNTRNGLALTPCFDVDFWWVADYAVGIAASEDAYVCRLSFPILLQCVIGAFVLRFCSCQHLVLLLLKTFLNVRLM